MKHLLFATLIAAGALALASPASAAVCANGVYRAGCAGPNGAAVVRKPVAVPRATVVRPPVVVAPHRTVTCAKGVYREGCAGPNGAVVRPR